MVSMIKLQDFVKELVSFHILVSAFLPLHLPSIKNAA